jgi:pilus assembly protein Flp/PilA
MHKHKRRSERGQGLVEYALILVLVAVVVILSLSVAGQQISQIFCTISLKLGGKVPNIPVCVDPRVTLSVGNGISFASGPIDIYATINDDKGGTEPNITKVDFYVDGASSPTHTEVIWKYCLGGGGDGGTACSTYSIANGNHTLRVVATDADGNTGEGSISFHVGP